MADSADEGKAIKDMAQYVAGITVQQRGLAQAGAIDPQINSIYQHITAELGKWTNLKALHDKDKKH